MDFQGSTASKHQNDASLSSIYSGQICAVFSLSLDIFIPRQYRSVLSVAPVYGQG